MDSKHNLFQAVLRQYWGYESFRPLQEEIISSVYSGRDTLALMPTGGGKSITFQVPSLAQDGICIVVTPLIALMKDQVDNLRNKNILATTVYTGMTQEKIKTQLENCVYGNYKFLYVSPERLHSPDFLRCVKAMRVNLIAVDEAHCISQWGYDFRPSYVHIAELRDVVPEVPILALTATATEDVVEDIQIKLGFRERNVLKKSFYRENLRYLVRETEDKNEYLLKILNNSVGTAIVYTRMRKKTKEVAQFLQSNGFESEEYHAGLSVEDKEARQNRWMRGETRVIVCTSAFGMGIDKPDVRVVVHVDMPNSLEEYYQEAGRAGRDGKKSYAVLLYNKRDEAEMHRRISKSYPDKDFIRKVYSKLCYRYSIGIGEGDGCSFVLDTFDFARRYGLNKDMVESSIEILKLNGYVSIRQPEELRSRIIITMTREDLYRDSVTDRQELGDIMEYLMRHYSGIFTDYVSINERFIAHDLCVNVQDLYIKLKLLRQEGIIGYVPVSKLPIITFCTPREEEERVYISASSFDDRKKREEMRAEAMINYASSSDKCRSQMLLEYFGEKDSKECGRCDVCVRKRKSLKR